MALPRTTWKGEMERNQKWRAERQDWFCSASVTHLPSRYAVAGHAATFTIVLITKFTTARSCGRCRGHRCGMCIIWRRMMR